MDERSSAIRRVLLALDDATDRDAFDAATALAGRLRAHLEGLFVEDTDLLRLAALPFAQEISLDSAAAQPLQLHQLKRILRARAAAVERMLISSADEHRLEWSFRVVRGRLAQLALEPAGSGELFVLARSSASLQPAPPAAQQGPLLVVFAGYPEDAIALSAAASIGEHDGKELRVLIAAEDEEKRELFSRQVRAILEIPMQLQGIAPTTEQLSAAVRAHRTPLLIVSASFLKGSPGDLRPLLETLPCPLIIVRQ